ncbi:DUF305 domain-containing protein [Sphingomonas sp. So64.6b]|uniref:DUF305 domain-containing protein n=1 Tax=Sphingomonas sp. So64.6b TaxID=2997354 RepID=UPI0016021156|nr:DUF305 domain-containing protein [Sphingomonas sp. So64.6b]QNA85490.1 DUF305 domain-containing protein [Sphingomonas sp. So64.6b]
MTDQKHLLPTQRRGTSTKRRVLLPVLFACLTGATSPSDPVGIPQCLETDFYRENDAAMTRMMVGMEGKPTGDVDRDFAAMMIPHHQGAIDMAIAELRHGRNPQLKRIAQEIIIEQQQEIAAMNLALGEPLPTSLPAPTQPDCGARVGHHHHTNR